MENIDFSNFTLYITILLALGLFVFLKILTRSLPAMLPAEDYRKNILRYKSLFEVLVWIIFITWSVRYLHQNNQPYSIALFVLLFLFLIYTGWIGLKDFVSGAMLKAGHRLTINETIKVEGYQGTITRFGATSLILESDSGETIYLPYSFLFGKIIVKSHPAESILRYTFRIEIARTASIREAIDQVYRFILNLPWISLTKEPQIKPISETADGQLVEVTLYSFEKRHFQDMEKLIKEKFALNQHTHDIVQNKANNK
jgi:hypothetical protein